MWAFEDQTTSNQHILLGSARLGSARLGLASGLKGLPNEEVFVAFGGGFIP